MKGLAALLATGSLVASAMTMGAAAEAATPRCATRAEWARIHTGDTPARVAAKVGTPGTFASGGAGGFERVYLECNTHGAQARVTYMWNGRRAPNDRDLVHSKQWNADPATPHGVSVLEYVMVAERAGAPLAWQPPHFDSGRIRNGPSRAVVERIFDFHGLSARGGARVYVAARNTEWNHDFGHAPQYWIIVCHYGPAGHLTRLQANRTGYRP